ncbi:MAG: hypothetical protein K1Y36_28575 [Blastocatellia bacterium]|nr:hypothetical protein [Blastocatellia bacterium]
MKDLASQSGSNVLDNALPRIEDQYIRMNVEFVAAVTETLHLPAPYLEGLVVYCEISGNIGILTQLIEFAKIEMRLDSLLAQETVGGSPVEAFSNAVRLVAGLHLLASCTPEMRPDQGTLQRFDCTPDFLATLATLGRDAGAKGEAFWQLLPALLEQTKNPFLLRGTPLWWAGHFLRGSEITGRLNSEVAQKYIDLAILEFKR